MIKELVTKNRSYRRFYQEVEITYSDLEELIDYARLSATGGNLQPLKFIISNTPEKNELIFKNLRWAAYLKDWAGPEEGEKPSAYIIMLGDKNIKKEFSFDAGIACQSILLGACEKGYGGCILANVDKKDVAAHLNIPDQYEIVVVIALGKPKEEVVIEDMNEDGDVKYWRDDQKIHHVPKRSLKDIILKL
ncbi:MAG: nitroreductase family protein [Clostridiales bacterium]|nr:nitroreductase family protein [Clostridiales bacterium]